MSPATPRAVAGRVRRPARRAALVVPVAALLHLLLPAAAVAHAELAGATPGPDATVTGSPPELVASFSQDLDGSRSSIIVRDASGATVAEGGKDPAEARIMRVALPALAGGVYEVRWTSFSAEDGELARGSYRFTVVAATRAPASPPPTSPSPRSTVLPTASSTPAPPVPPASTSPVEPSPGPGAPTDAAEATPWPMLLVAAIAGLLVGGLIARARRRS